jgi:hypothetical protein
MKIISKYKDYYDYLVGIYGVDEKIVLDRTEFEIANFYSPTIITFYIAGKCVDGYWDGKMFYFGEDLKQFCKDQQKDTKNYPKWKLRWMNFGKDPNSVVVYNDSWGRKQRTAYPDLRVDETKTNEKHNCAIMCTSSINISTASSGFFRYPKLEDLGIITILPPHEIYMMLSEWLAPKDKTVDTLSNLEKIVAAGFDKKTSFRNIK